MRTASNVQLLDLCHPMFAERVAIALVPASQIVPIRVVCTYRPLADQLEAYNEGRSDTLYGFHNCEDREGRPAALACDIVELDEKPYSEEPELYARLAIEAWRNKLRTGLLFGLAENQRLPRQRAIARGNFSELVDLIAPPRGRRGWDPLHIEAGPVLIEQVRADITRMPAWRIG